MLPTLNTKPGMAWCGETKHALTGGLMSGVCCSSGEVCAKMLCSKWKGNRPGGAA